MSSDNLNNLLSELTSQSQECEWIEWKENDAKPEDIGEYISALSNSALLSEKNAGYLLWGVEDKTGKIVGTTFNPREIKIGNQELENWLATLLTPRVDFHFHEITQGSLSIVILEIQSTTNQPVRFKDTEYIRIGSYKKKLKDHPEKERKLWSLFSQTTFEIGFALTNVNPENILKLIDYPSYFDLTNQQLPENRDGILARLVSEKLISKIGNLYNITNLGAILFAKNLGDFERLSRKAIRVVIYNGANRIETIREQKGTKGYAVGFEGAIEFINDQLPHNEQIGHALRHEVTMYPKIAIRELVANAIIHQDFSMTGNGPLIEIFSDRIEITNPGVPLIDPMRFIDEPPQSRNEALAAFMRRIKICEERGSGIDKVVFQVELYQLPAPNFSVISKKQMKVILYSYKKLAKMDKHDKIRACYQHACLCNVSNQLMTNATLRKRFAIDDKNYATASRIIADTIKVGLIKPYDATSSSRKHAKYLPIWA